MTDAKVIGFCGTRGVPANYGGFETAVDEISRRFVKRGYNCVVFCRMSSNDLSLDFHEGRRLVYVKGTSIRALDTIVSSFQVGWHLLRYRREYGHAFWFNNANLPGILLTLLAHVPTSINTDGLEWRRAKWRWPFKAYYFFSTVLITRLCKRLISDSRAVQAYYRKALLKETEYIPYGVPSSQQVSTADQLAILERYSVEKERYLLQITRFEPDNLPLETARAFQTTGLAKDGFRLLLIGYHHETPYASQIRAMSGKNGIVVGKAVYDAETLATLRSNCFCYVHGNSVGGTNPALLEAMTCSPRILAIDGPFSRELLGDTGFYYIPASLADSLRGMLNYPDQSVAMRDRALSRYNWESVTRSYARLTEEKPADYSPIHK